MGRSGFPVSSTGCATWRIGQQDHFIIKQLNNHQWVAGESERTYLKNILHLEQNILRSTAVQDGHEVGIRRYHLPEYFSLDTSPAINILHNP